MFLLAQQDFVGEFAIYPPWMIAAGAVLFFGIVFFWMVFRQAGKSRHFAHLERMKALELGQPNLQNEPVRIDEKYGHKAFWIAFWLAAVVPIAATSSVASVMSRSEVLEFRTTLVMWICVAVISVASVICGAALMMTAKPRRRKEKEAPPGSTPMEGSAPGDVRS